MADADKNHTPIAWPLLADVLRHVVSRKRTPEADIRAEILEAMRSGKLPHRVDCITTYPPRLPGASRRGESPLPTIDRNAPISTEVLTVGFDGGRGSLHIDWRNSRATRRAGSTRDGQTGLTWGRIEFEGIRCSTEHVHSLWPPAVEPGESEPLVQALQRVGSPSERLSAKPPFEPPSEPRTKRDRLLLILKDLDCKGRLKPDLMPAAVERLISPPYRKRWGNPPSRREIARAYKTHLASK
jgi:hypothetical protein